MEVVKQYYLNNIVQLIRTVLFHSLIYIYMKKKKKNHCDTFLMNNDIYKKELKWY